MLGTLKRLFDLSKTSDLERALLEIASDIWEVEAQTGGQHYPSFEHPYAGTAEERQALQDDRERRVAHSFDRLLARWPEPVLTTLVADMYFDARGWYDRYAWDYRRPEATRWLWPAQGRIIVYLLHRWVALHPPADLVARLRRRLVQHFRQPHAGPPTTNHTDYPYPPAMRACLDLLRGLDGAEADALVYDLVRGEFDVVPEPCNHPHWGHAPLTSGYGAFSHELDRATPWLLRRVWLRGLLDEALLEGVFRRQRHVLNLATSGLTRDGHAAAFFVDLGPEASELVDQLAGQIVRRWADGLDETNARHFSEVGRLQGKWYLIRACQHIERLRLKRLPSNDYSHRGELAAAVTRMCAVAPLPEEGEAEVIEALRAFKERTLLLALPIAVRYQPAICRALGWDGAYELIRLIQRVAHHETTNIIIERDVRNSPDPTDGVLDPHPVRELYAQLGEKRFAALRKAFTDFPNSTKNTLYLVQAALGMNSTKVLEGFAKRNQIAVKALGLLPIAEPDEVLRRYLALRQFAREASQFGMQRQTNERAAVAVALANLALNAGYPDATRLEWAMEDRLGAQIGVTGRTWPIDERYMVKLEVSDGGPELTAFKDGKPLRSLPAAVRRHPDYPAMKEAKAELRAQARRYRVALEAAMCRGEDLAIEELKTLSRNPTASRMLGALVIADQAGTIGLYDADATQILDAGDARHPVVAPVRIVHPLALYQRGLLADWQREVIRRRLVQPFKQAFRELYVVTPAELATRHFSRRFGGQVIEPAQAARLLQAEGWECIGEDYPRKTFRDAGITACLTFTESYHYMSEIDALTVDEVCFLPAGGPNWWSETRDPRLPLDQVPALIFSEVMRDIDLVVSVAQHTGQAVGEVGAGANGTAEQLSSAEMVVVRAALVRDLAADLGYRNISVDGHHARIHGQRADYRVHLGSAVIHIEPGAYLCIVPARWGQRHDKLFLPFTAEDIKTSEVISKVLLLAEDNKIKDESILRQIQARAR